MCDREHVCSACMNEGACARLARGAYPDPLCATAQERRRMRMRPRFCLKKGAELDTVVAEETERVMRNNSFDPEFHDPERRL